MKYQRLITLTTLLAGAGVGCTGSILGDGSTPGGPGNGPSGPGGPSGPAGPGGTSTTPGTGTMGGGTVTQPTKPTNPGTPADPNAAGPMALRRLTNREYNNTVRDLLGVTTKPADMFPSDRDGEFLFPHAGVVTGADYESISGAAEAMATGAAGKIPMLAPCTGDEAACARDFITKFGLRAYRRPLAQQEVDRLFALYQDGRANQMMNFQAAVGLLIEGMLQSPAFLYHWELGYENPLIEGKVIRLNHFENASRLSYFLWGTMPDADLFTAAQGGKLGTQAEIEAQARRMLTDPRARETITAFAGSWLNLDQVISRPKDLMVYPEWQDNLKNAMDAEVRSFLTSVVFEGDGKFSSLLTATNSFVNAPLASLYGAAGVTGTEMKPMLLDGAQRAGILTRAGFLTVTGAADGSHPVKRGRRVYERFLCGELPPPPADVQPAMPASAGGTTRERYEEHDRNPCTGACHQLMDPIGFGFEHYDGIGKYRTMDNGGVVDASGSISLDGQTRKFNDARELSGHLAGSPEVARCFATQWLRFATQREDGEADRASLDAVTAAFTKGDVVKDLLVALAGSRTFRYRSPNAGEKLP
jgi:hypothetical protein